MTKDEQLELDLTQNATDRLRTWMKDTHMRCEVADISPTRQMAILTSVLMYQLMQIWEAMEVGPAEAGRVTYDLYKGYIEHFNSKESKKPNKVK